MGKSSKTRREQEGKPQAAPQQQQQTTESKVTKILLRTGVGLMCLLVVVGLVWGAIYSSGLAFRMTAMTVGDYEISALEFDMYYVDQVTNLLYSMGYTSADRAGFETSMYDTNQTWGDYLRSQIVSQLTEMYVMYGEAEAAGYDYAADTYAQTLYQSQLDQLAEAAEIQGMSVEKFLKSVYGSKMDMEDFEEFLRRRYVYAGYVNQLEAEITADDEEVAMRYEENKDTYDVVSYRYFTIPYEEVTYTEPAEGETLAEGAPKSAEEAEAMTEENRKAAEETANEMLGRITGEQSFIELAREYASEEDKEAYADDDATLVTNGSPASTSPLAMWYKDAARFEGETAVIDNEAGGYVVTYFLERKPNDERTVNVRHILFTASAAAEDATEEEKAEAAAQDAEQKAKAEQIYEQWKSGEMTEDSFGLLAIEHSQDGSAARGGLYENVADGDMVTEFNDWIFDESRQTGDSEIVKTSYGYHIIYFVGEGLPVWEAEARTDVRNDKFNALYTQVAQKYPVTTNSFALNL